MQCKMLRGAHWRKAWQMLAKLKKFASILYRANGRGGFGSQTAADLSGDPPNVPEKQTLGTVVASHKVLTLQALSSSLDAGTAKRGFLGGVGKETLRLVGDLRQSVPQNGRVHLLGVCWKPLSLNFCQTVCTRSENMPEPHPNHIRTTSEPHPNHIRTTSEPRPKQYRRS